MKRRILLISIIPFACLGYLLVHSFSQRVIRPYLTIVGSVCMADGLGRQSVELMSALGNKYSVNFIPTTEVKLQEVPSLARKILKKPNHHQGKVVLFEDCVWVPGKDHYKILDQTVKDQQVRIAYSMFESTTIPSQWVDIFNHFFDAVIVPDVFHREVYQSCGVTKPIFILPLGLDLSTCLKKPLKVSANRPFIFGTMGAGISRKNLLKTLKAFHKAFGNHPDVCFAVHCRYALPEIEREIKDFIIEHQIENIHYSHKRLTKKKYLEKFRQIDCFVNLSMGEGFSIQPREAMALGIPTMLSDNTAQSSICATGLVKALPSKIRTPARRRWGGLLLQDAIYGEEFDWDINEAAQAFREVYEHYPDYLSLSHRARQWAANFDYPQLKKKYETLIAPKKIVYGETNEIFEDCLITNSRELMRKYRDIAKSSF